MRNSLSLHRRGMRYRYTSHRSSSGRSRKPLAAWFRVEDVVFFLVCPFVARLMVEVVRVETVTFFVVRLFMVRLRGEVVRVEIVVTLLWFASLWRGWG